MSAVCHLQGIIFCLHRASRQKGATPTAEPTRSPMVELVDVQRLGVSSGDTNVYVCMYVLQLQDNPQ